MACEHPNTMVNVPAAFATLVAQMAQATGLPENVVAAQAQAESGFNATAVSSAGAEGWLQFLPSTYNQYASQAGVAPGTEFNPADEAKVYDAYMNALLQQEKGNVRNALAAYNAGPGNLAAGYGYADSILSAAGQGSNLTTSTQPASASTAGLFGIPGLPTFNFSVSGITSGIVNTILNMLGLKTGLKDMMERLGLIILGFALVIVGIKILASGGSSSGGTTSSSSSDESEEETATESEPSEPPPPIKRRQQQMGRTNRPTQGKTMRRRVPAVEGVGADEAIEAAAIALWHRHHNPVTTSTSTQSAAGFNPRE
jgi:hypothetical protein